MSYTLSRLKAEPKRKAIRLYQKAFTDHPAPCPTCKQSCCKSCELTRGYLDVSDKTFELYKSMYGWVDTGHRALVYSHGFKALLVKKREGAIDHGFFKAGKGCALPLEKRSLTCIGYICEEFPKEQQEAAYKMRNIFYEEDNLLKR